MNNIIVGMGEALWDVLPEGKKIGGAPANFAYHVSQFGFDSRVVSAVGNDELGDEIMEVFKEKQLKNQIDFVPLGNWHSHPESPSRPSDEDKRLAYDSQLLLLYPPADVVTRMSHNLERCPSQRFIEIEDFSFFKIHWPLP